MIVAECSNSTSASTTGYESKNGRFIIVEKQRTDDNDTKSTFYITTLVDKNTKGMYVLTEAWTQMEEIGTGMVLLVDAEGKLLIYQGDLNSHLENNQ